MRLQMLFSLSLFNNTRNPSHFLSWYLNPNHNPKPFCMRKHAFLLILVFLSSCFTQKQATIVTKETFTFDYSPKMTATPGSAGMVLAFMKPYYALDFTASSGELFQNFQSSLGNDIEEQIIAKGFSMKGPFQSYDELVFDDKKSTDMVIQIEISPKYTAAEGYWSSHLAFTGRAYTTYSYSGKVSIVGKINLSGIEPLTNEKIWAKSVSIPNIENIPISTSQNYARILNDYELIQDPGVYNALGKALRAQYAGIMEKIAAHFNVEEFNSLKPQIKELKAKKGY